MEIKQHFITFGVQYGLGVDDEQHPQGMTGDGYAVIEAPDEGMARQIANAIFGQRWSFIYDEQPKAEYATRGELLRIAWQPAQQLLTASQEDARINAMVDYLADQLPEALVDYADSPIEGFTKLAQDLYLHAHAPVAR